MKKFIVVLLAIIMMVPAFALAANAATDTIQIPYASKAPSIDGKGNDEAWESAYKTTLNPKTAMAEGHYVEEKGNTSDAATADIAVLWNEKGLYLKWVVVDPTQSFALDLPNNQLNSMDGVQLVIDPFNKRFATIKNCAFCFTFVPYTCPRGSGNGQVPTGEASWYEHWQWVGMNNSLGLQFAVTLDSRPDDDNDGLDREILVSGYTVEVFLPVEALNLNGKNPTFEENTNIGIGFMLIDYLYDHEKFEAAGKDPEAGQVIYNFSIDFGTSKNDIGKPSKYNTAVLVKEISEEPVAQTPYESLQNSIKLAEEYIAEQDKYTETSIAALQAAIDEAKSLTESASEAECLAAQEKLGMATNGLVLKADDTLANQIKLAESIVDQCESTGENNYTEESWKAFIDALEAAKAIAAQDGFDEASEEAQAAKRALEEAKNALTTVADSGEMPDVSGLESAINAAEKVKRDEYTPASYDAFTAVLEKAREVLKKAGAGEATQKEVNDAKDELKAANSALVRKDATTGADTDPERGFSIWLIILIVVVVLAAIAVVVIVVLKKKKALPAEGTEAVKEEGVSSEEDVSSAKSAEETETEEASEAGEADENSESNEENNE